MEMNKKREYNNPNEVSEVVGLFDKNSKDKIQIRHIKNTKSKKEYIDIRQMYTEDDELKYTKKGIRLDSELCPDVIVSMLRALGEDRIQDILQLLGK